MNKKTDISPEYLADLSNYEGTLSQRVYLAIKASILALHFEPGQNLRKAPICERFGVSRAPVAEAITKLASEGLVDVVPQSGTHISYLSMPEIHEGTFLREALELATVAKVARDLTDQQHVQLRRNIRMQELLTADGDNQGFYEADEEFHGLLMGFTGFPHLAEVAHSVSVQVTRARMLLLPTEGRVAETLAEHVAIFDAVEARDPDAAQAAMRHHLGQIMPRIELLHEDQPHLFNDSVHNKRVSA